MNINAYMKEFIRVKGKHLQLITEYKNIDKELHKVDEGLFLFINLNFDRVELHNIKLLNVCETRQEIYDRVSYHIVEDVKKFQGRFIDRDVETEIIEMNKEKRAKERMRAGRAERRKRWEEITGG